MYPKEAKNSQTLWFQAKQPLHLLSRRMSRMAFRHEMARYAGNQLLVHLYELSVHLYQVLDFFKDGKTFLIDNIQRGHLHLFRSRLIF